MAYFMHAAKVSDEIVEARESVATCRSRAHYRIIYGRTFSSLVGVARRRRRLLYSPVHHESRQRAASTALDLCVAKKIATRNSRRALYSIALFSPR